MPIRRQIVRAYACITAVALYPLFVYLSVSLADGASFFLWMRFVFVLSLMRVSSLPLEIQRIFRQLYEVGNTPEPAKEEL